MEQGNRSNQNYTMAEILYNKSKFLVSIEAAVKIAEFCNPITWSSLLSPMDFPLS